MGLFNKQQKLNSSPQELTAEEIELILKLLSTTTFPVRDIERLYQAILKLQNEYSRLKPT